MGVLKYHWVIQFIISTLVVCLISFSISLPMLLLYAQIVFSVEQPFANIISFLMLILIDVMIGLVIYKMLTKLTDFYRNGSLVYRALKISVPVIFAFLLFIILLTPVAESEEKNCKQQYENAIKASAHISDLVCIRFTGYILLILSLGVYMGPHNPLTLFLGLYILKRYSRLD